MTQGDASLAASTHRNGSVPFRRNWAVAESRAETPPGRPHQLAGTDGPDGRGGPRAARPGRHDASPPAPRVSAASSGTWSSTTRPTRSPPPAPTSSSSSAPGCPPADPANCRALVERLDSMGTAALAFRRTEGPAPVPGEVLAEADRRGLPGAGAAARTSAWTRSSPRCSAPSSPSRARRSRCPPAWTTSSWRSRSPAAGWPEVAQRLAVMLDGTAVLGLGPDREVVTSAGPRGRRRRDQRLAVAARRRRRRRPGRADAVPAAVRRPRRPDRGHPGRRPRRRRPLTGRRHPARARPPRAARRGGGVRRRPDHGRRPAARLAGRGAPAPAR